MQMVVFCHLTVSQIGQHTQIECNDCSSQKNKHILRTKQLNKHIMFIFSSVSLLLYVYSEKLEIPAELMNIIT